MPQNKPGTLPTPGNNRGYHSCPCRDCFEIAIGEDEDGTPSLCHCCDKAGCDGEGECDAPHAYNQHCGDVACCGALHPAGEDFEEHAPSEQWYARCKECNQEGDTES